MDVDIKEDPELLQQEEDGFPFTIIAVKIGENGTIEENKDVEPVFSSDPRILLNKYEEADDSSETDNSEDWTELDKSPANNSSIKPDNKRKKKVNGISSSTGKRPFICPYCEKGFGQKTNLDAHIRTHTGEKPFECSVCNKKFNQKSNLSTHMKTHTGEKRFSCSVCGKGFWLKQHFTTHLKLHTKKKQFSCSSCKCFYANKSVYVRHMKTHEREKQFRSCVEKSNLKQNLEQPIPGHTGKNTRRKTPNRGLRLFNCEECGAGFGEKQWLERHMAVHNVERPFSCNICKKRFAIKTIYEAHMRTHTGERPYSCAVCNKRFTHTSNLRSHIKTHTGEKPFSCPVCHKRYTRIYSVKLHMAVHEGEIKNS